MTGALSPRAVLVTREDDYELMMARHATRGQAQFFLRARRQSLDSTEQRHQDLKSALAEVRAAVPRDWRIAQVKRDDLDSFLFGPEDVIVAVGQDGLVANVAKYLHGQPVIGVNPEPDRNPGLLVPHAPGAVAKLLAPAASGHVTTQDRTMLRAELDTGQSMLALNEVFVGHATHQSARYIVEFSGRSEAQSSSGLIVASGTGATGWALSIGRATGVTLDLAPTDRAAAFLVREPWPSRTTGADVVFGRLGAQDRLRVVSRMNDGGVVFADGIEKDRLSFGFGAGVQIGVADEVLRVVPAEPSPMARQRAGLARRRAVARAMP